jgi:type IV secretion system protein VirD4
VLTHRFSKKTIFFVSLLVFFILASEIFKITSGIQNVYPHEPIIYSFITDSPALLKKIKTAYLISFIIVVFIISLLLIPKKASLYGDARFAYALEFFKVFGKHKTGILLGILEGKKIIIDGLHHFLINAETRSGKGVSWILPMLFFWRHSAIVHDVKKELFLITSGFRKYILGHEVYLINIMDDSKETHSFNIFDAIPNDIDLHISFLQKVANFLTPTPPGVDPIWTGNARTLFLGICLLIRDIPNMTLSLPQIFRVMHPQQPLNEYLTDLINEHDEILDPLCKMYLWKWINITPKTRDGILTQLTGVFDIYANPIVCAATETSSFDITKIKNNKMTIYVRSPAKYIKEVSPVASLFFQFAIDMNMEIPHEMDKNYKHPCLFIMDEFSALGPMPVFAEKIELVLGFALCFVLVIQSETQLSKDYGPIYKKIISNCKIKGYLKPNELDDAELLSKKLRDTTVFDKSRRKGYFSFDNEPIYNKVKRPLMNVDEVMSMPNNECIVFIKEIHPMRLKRAIWYEDRVMKKLPKKPIKIPKIKIVRHNILQSNTLEVDIDSVVIEGLNKEKILSDAECIDASNKLFATLGIKI